MWMVEDHHHQIIWFFSLRFVNFNRALSTQLYVQKPSYLRINKKVIYFDTKCYGHIDQKKNTKQKQLKRPNQAYIRISSLSLGYLRVLCLCSISLRFIHEHERRTFCAVVLSKYTQAQTHTHILYLSQCYA